MSNNKQIELLKKYLRGELSKSELGEFTDIFCNEISEKNFEAAIENEMEFLTSQTNDNPEIMLKGYSRLLQHMNLKNRARGSLRLSRKVKQATLAVLIFSFSAALLFFADKRMKHEEPGEKIEVPVSKIEHLQLTDSSEIWLNSKSAIQWNKSEFNKEYREVYLDGQAFFKVKRNVKRPFIVHLEAFNIKVTGTSFDVKSYSNENDVEVSLKSGGIVIDGASANRLSISAGQQFKFNKVTKTGEIRKVDVSDFIAWRSGQFRYEKTELQAIAKAIERWFDVEIAIENEDMKNYILTVNQKDSSLEEILEAISYVTGMKHYQTGKKIVFYKEQKE